MSPDCGTSNPSITRAWPSRQTSSTLSTARLAIIYLAGGVTGAAGFGVLLVVLAYAVQRERLVYRSIVSVIAPSAHTAGDAIRLPAWTFPASKHHNGHGCSGQCHLLLRAIGRASDRATGLLAEGVARGLANASAWDPFPF